MAKLKLIYFDFPAGRGEDCRMALHVAGVDFIDERIPRQQWADLKPKTPYGGLPVLEVEGKPHLAQSNAILAFIGRTHDLHPKDPLEAAQHEAIMMAAEELRTVFGPSLRTQDEAEKKRLREAIVASDLPRWASNIERQLGPGPFIAGEKLHVADIKLFGLVGWLTKRVVDYVPDDVFAPYPKLTALHDAVRHHPKIAEWQARFA